MENIKIAKKYNYIGKIRDITDSSIDEKSKLNFIKLYQITTYMKDNRKVLTYLYKLQDNSYLYKAIGIAIPLTRMQVKMIFNISD